MRGVPIFLFVLGVGLSASVRAQDDAADEPPSEAGPAEETAVGEEATEGVAATEDSTPENVLLARRYFDEGTRLFEDGRFEAALAQFRASFDQLEGHEAQYTVIYNIAQSLERLGRPDEARARYARFLELAGPDAENRDRVLARVAALGDIVGTLVVSTGVSSTEIWSGDRLLGHAGDELRLSVGRHGIELRAPGHVPLRREVEITVGGATRLEVTLEARERGLDPFFFGAAAGLTAISLGVAVGFGVAAQLEHDRGVLLLAGDDEDRFLVDEEYEANKDRLALTADIFFAVAGAFAIATVILAALTEWSGEPEDASVVLAPMVGPGLAGLAGGGTW